MVEPAASWPRVVLVTDRRRLTARMGADELTWPALLTAQIRGAVTGGVDLVQVREPDLDARPLAAFLRALFHSVPGSASKVVVNDRVDVALAIGARGVHLPQESIRVADIRGWVSADKKFVIGRSVHSAEAAADSDGADYLIAGTINPSESKPRSWPTLGWSGFRTVVESARPLPVVAIGGLSEQDVPEAVLAGATGIAGIGCFLPAGSGDLTKFVQERVISMRLAFDTSEGVSYTQRADR